jgi:hypothetical protein
MAHFAKLDQNNIVLEVNVVDNEHLLDADGVEHEELGIEFLVQWSGGYTNWKQTSYNGTIRKNYAGIGFTYDAVKDAFIEPQPYPSWTLNETTCRWEPPMPYPSDEKDYVWDEATTSWVEITE